MSRAGNGRPDGSIERSTAGDLSRPVKPVFVVNVARSGSTLLRYLLDTHRDVTCPPELNLSVMMREVVSTWNRVMDALGEPPPESKTAPLHPEVVRQARATTDALMTSMADHAGASVFCDKSLTTANDISIVSQLYPDASFIFLYRFPLDMIASGIEAQKWGFHSYGFGSYIRSSAGNFVSALAAYWIDRTTRMLDFERSCGSPHLRVHYEHLCDDPELTLARIVGFLGLPVDDSIVPRALSIPHQTGMADYKVDFRTSIGSESVGRGASLPRLITSEQEVRIDEMLAELEYPSLEAAWRGGLSSALGLRSAPSPASVSDAVVEELMRTLAERAADPANEAALAHAPFEIVVHTGGREVVMEVGGGGSVEMRESVNGESPPDGQIAAKRLQFICKDDVIADIVAGRMGLAEAINEQRMRIVGAGNPATVRGRGDNRKLLAAVGTLLRPPDA